MLIKSFNQSVFLNLIYSGKEKGPGDVWALLLLVRRFWFQEEGFELFAGFY
jgi:hypothetical protein